MREIIDLLRPHQETRDDLAAVDLLARSGHHPGLHQRQQAVGEHFGMDSQVAPVRELRQHRIRNLADAELQTGAVLDQFGAVAADDPLHLVRRLERHGFNRSVMGNDVVDPVQRNHRIPQRERDMAVHHRDHHPGAFDRRQRDIHRGSQRHPAVAVGTRNLNHRDIQR